jgi:hypothetical protein
MHTSQIHQHVEKNSVLLKEVLTHRGERARGAFVDNIVLHSRDDADGARKCDAGECNIAGSGCAAGVFVILTLIIETQSSSRRLIDTSRKRIVWTLSLAFWQQKNFYGSGLVSDGRSPKRLFCASRRRRFGGTDFDRDDASMHARPSIEAAAITPATASTRRSDAQFGFEQIVHCLRIGLAAG